jgi:hypothetical protein
MPKMTKRQDQSVVDEALVAMFINMSPEDRLRANDKALQVILELRDGYKRHRSNQRESE